MRKSHYTKIIVEGFQSIESQLVFKLDNVGLNIIRGLNGAGKSTLFNAIIWAEFNHNLKHSVETWEELRTANFRGTRVVIERTDGKYVYRVARHLKFKGKTTGLTGGSKLMLFKRSIDEPKFTDAHLIGEGLQKSDMQKIIEEQLGVDLKTFMNSIFFGQKIQSLVMTDNASKRNLFDELFDADFLVSAKEKAKIRQDELSTSTDLLSHDITDLGDKIDTLASRLSEQEEVLETFATKKKARIKTANDKLMAVLDKKTELSGALSKLAKERATYDVSSLAELKDKRTIKKAAVNTAVVSFEAATKDVSNCDKETEKAESQMQKLRTSISNIATTCPACEGAITKAKIKTVTKNIQDQIKAEQQVIKQMVKSKETYTKLLGIAEKNKNSAEDELTKIDTKIDKFSDAVNNVTRLESEIKNKNERIADNITDIEEAEKSLTAEKAAQKPNVDPAATKAKIAVHESEVTKKKPKLAKELAELDKVKWWNTKGFGSTGLKAFIFNAMLTKLNSIAYEYASKLGFRVEFSVDMTKASKPFQTMIYKGDSVKDYRDLSGGQQQRVNICIAFAMHDLVTMNSSINILVMDEVFEGLDKEGIELVFELIRVKAETKSVYLITHEETIDSMGTRSFTFAQDENELTYLLN